MKIVAIYGSPRKGNSDALTDAALETLNRDTTQIEKVYLRELDFKGCVVCMECKYGKSDKCILKDDLSPVLDSVMNADLLVFATPVYFSDVSWLFKTFVDRLYSFIEYTDEGYVFRVQPGTEVLFIVTQLQSTDRHRDILERYSETFTWLGYEKVHTVHEGGMRAPDLAAKNDEMLQRVKATGEAILK